MVQKHRIKRSAVHLGKKQNRTEKQNRTDDHKSTHFYSVLCNLKQSQSVV